MKKYFLEPKTAKGKVEISSFHQFPDESLSEALDRFHGLLWKIPTHWFSESVQLNIFIDGFWPHSKQLHDASTGGKIKLKTPDEAMELMENMTASDHAILRDRAYTPCHPSRAHITRRITSLKQAPSQATRDPHRDTKQASSTIASSATYPFFSHAHWGMQHLWWGP